MKKKYTIEDLKNGVCAVKNDGTLEELREVLGKAFPNDDTKLDHFMDIPFFYKWEYDDDGDWNYASITDLPTQSVKDFLYPAQHSKLFYTEATDRLKELQKVAGNAYGKVDEYTTYFSNHNTLGETGYFAADTSKAMAFYIDNHVEQVTEQEFIKRMGLDVEYIDTGISEFQSKLINGFKKYLEEIPKSLKIESNSFAMNSVDSKQPHYNNDNGSLYKLAESLGLNHWEFDIFKRLVRCRKKGQFEQDLKKIKDTCDIYLKEHKGE